MVACWQRSAGFAFVVNGRLKFIFPEKKLVLDFRLANIRVSAEKLKLDLPASQNSLLCRKIGFWSSQTCFGVNGTLFFMSNANSNNSLCCYFRKQEALLQDSYALSMNSRLL